MDVLLEVFEINSGSTHANLFLSISGWIRRAIYDVIRLK